LGFINYKFDLVADFLSGSTFHPHSSTKKEDRHG